MSLSHRHRQILELLLSHKDEITAGEIAAEIGVSSRTVHRELSELETILTDSGLTLQKKSEKASNCRRIAKSWMPSSGSCMA